MTCTFGWTTLTEIVVIQFCFICLLLKMSCIALYGHFSHSLFDHLHHRLSLHNLSRTRMHLKSQRGDYLSSFLSGGVNCSRFSVCVKNLGRGQDTLMSPALVPDSVSCRACIWRGRCRILLCSSPSFPSTRSGNCCASKHRKIRYLMIELF